MGDSKGLVEHAIARLFPAILAEEMQDECKAIGRRPKDAVLLTKQGFPVAKSLFLVCFEFGQPEA